MVDLSFCIHVKNRAEHIKQTLPINLINNLSSSNKIEFVVVDFGSTDGLKDYICGNFCSELSSGYLSYYYTEELPVFHVSISKNTSHYFSSGEINVTLDADNFTGKGGGEYIINKFKYYGGNIVLHLWSGEFRDGTFGRIAFLKKYFEEVGGYDESLPQMTAQDEDLMDRLVKKSDLEYIRPIGSRIVTRLPRTLKFFKKYLAPYSIAVRHDVSQSLKYVNGSLDWYSLQEKSKSISLRNISSGKLVANNGVYGIRKNVLKWVDGELVRISDESGSNIASD